MSWSRIALTWARGHRPYEDPRASKVRPLDSAGVGGGRVPPDKTTWGLTMALIVGVVAPLALLVWLLWGAMGPIVRTLLCIGIALVILRGVRQARAARNRARDREAARSPMRAE